jgi:DNA-binding transcriptional MocR family regulator
MAMLLGRGAFAASRPRALPRYRRRRDARVEALDRQMPKGGEWTRPGGGFSVWLTLEGRERGMEIYRGALQHGLVLAPGEVFRTGAADGSHLRLCFGNLPEALLREAVGTLAMLLRARPGRERGRGGAGGEVTPLV